MDRNLIDALESNSVNAVMKVLAAEGKPVPEIRAIQEALFHRIRASCPEISADFRLDSRKFLLKKGIIKSKSDIPITVMEQLDAMLTPYWSYPDPLAFFSKGAGTLVVVVESQVEKVYSRWITALAKHADTSSCRVMKSIVLKNNKTILFHRPNDVVTIPADNLCYRLE